MTTQPNPEGPRRALSRAQKVVLAAAFVPMLATGIAGGVGTYSNISAAYGSGTALGAVAAGEGATAVLALVLLGLTMLGQSSPLVVRVGLWALPAASSVMSGMAAGDDPGKTVIYAVTPMGMCVAAEGMAFLARRIVVHTDGRDADAERKAAEVVQALAFHRARAANHPDAKVQARSERTSWKLARRVGIGDVSLGARLVDVQRERVTSGADAALMDMFSVTATTAVTPGVTPAVTPATSRLELEAPTAPSEAGDTQDSAIGTAPEIPPVPPVTAEDAAAESGSNSEPAVTPLTLAEVATVAGVVTPQTGETLTDDQLVVVLRHLRYSEDPPLSYRRAAASFREAGFVGSEKRVRVAWGALLSQEENTR
ncbi:hypothetical protein [Streptomyces sp. NBC_00154]|uniref:hypothetical protein n=1 Tax=Streptomyces sp. NBC_00154 TaxID=2975670 RepID=UPI0022581649|nr:hypothetical protein [Streptomyces sp. NBC_00154]MCX5312116.1 hypothetical protein [Streptomyces sp. NBC_00154]